MKNKIRKNHEIDATGKVLGRLATEIATLLRGKHKVTFTPHIDDGDIVTIFNVDKIKVTGNKMNDKIYRHHSGYPGGLKEEKMSKLFAKDPADILRRAVWNMLPKNKLRSDMIKRLKVK